MKICLICCKSDDCPHDYGDFLQKYGVTVHYYCLLLSTNLPQRGNDKTGILGFILADIKKEADRMSKKKCHYCNLQGASIKCAKCNKYFHQICGNSNSCLFEYIGEFHSYCHEHITVAGSSDLLAAHSKDELCSICALPMEEYNAVTSISGGCCNQGWAHRTCMRKYALNAGYYLRCIWCRSPVFRDLVRYRNVFVPDRDASWEKSKNAYRELLGTEMRCDAKTCLNSHGRRYSDNRTTNRWFIRYCTCCGIHGIHNGCWTDKMPGKSFRCDYCVDLFNRTKSGSPLMQSVAELNFTLYMEKTLLTVEYDEYGTHQNETLPSKVIVKESPNLGELKTFYLFDDQEALIGEAKGYLKNPSVNKELTKEDVILIETKMGFPDWIENIIQDYLREKNCGDTIMVHDTDGDDKDTDELFDEMAAVDNYNVPKPLMK